MTDRYDYDAWGEVDHLSGSTADNPYLYVGELGYYDHWQAPALADMLHLGVRFYEPEVGRVWRTTVPPGGRQTPSFRTRYPQPAGRTRPLPPTPRKVSK